MLHKHKDLDLDPDTHTKARYSVVGKRQIPKLSYRFSERPCLKIIWGVIEEDT